MFYFRAASGRKIVKKSETSYVIDRLTVRMKDDHKGIVRDGEPNELLIPLTLPQGKSTLTLEYQW